VIVADSDSWTVLRDRTPSSILIIDPSLDLSREETNRAINNQHHLTPPNSRWTPHWAPSVSPEVISACLLLAGWDSREADQAAFSRIAGRAYAECQTELQIMASSRDPLLLRAAGKWRLISKDFAWSLFEARVTTTALERFEALSLEILADDDPRYLLPEDDRFPANIKGHVPKYSETIKRHVAETLAFLGAFGERLQVASSTDIISAIDRIVASVVA